MSLAFERAVSAAVQAAARQLVQTPTTDAERSRMAQAVAERLSTAAARPGGLRRLGGR